MFSADATAYALSIDSYGNAVTTTATAMATSDIIEEDAFNKATEIAQNVADSQLQTDINISDQPVETSVSVKGEQGFTDDLGSTHDTGVTGSVGITGSNGSGFWLQSGSSIYYSSGNVGINTNNPSTNLDITGSLKTTADSSINRITIGRGNGNFSNNTVVGAFSLRSNTRGNNNTAIGEQSLYSNTSGSSNTSSGAYSLRVNTTGTNNTASGSSSLLYNTTGSNNTASGSSSLQNNTTGSDNTSSGVYSLCSNTTGNLNTASGSSSLQNNKTGSNNTALGYGAGINNTTGTNNTYIGYGATGTTNNASNEITLGNSSITALRCHAQTISTLSDQRDKKDIEPLGSSLSFVEQLKPVHFNWNMRDGGKVDIPEIGFIAQDLQKVQLDTGMKVPNLVYDVNPDRLEASYATLLPLLVKSIQELSTEVQDLKKEITFLKEKTI